MAEQPPSKRLKLLSDDDDSSDEDGLEGGVPVKLGFNEDYAKRFEHNKKRAEQHRLEEKYGKGGNAEDDESDESTDEEEDEYGELADGVLEEEFQATLKALKNKDPRIYDKNHKFYSTDPDADVPSANGQTKEKPLYLSDYHRNRLLNGDTGEDEGPGGVQTYAQEQEDIRKSFMAAAEADEPNGNAKADGEAFLTHKSRLEVPATRGSQAELNDDIRNKAKDDPDRFLSAFMDNKGWLPKAGSELHAFESDDEDFDDLQDEFEHKYNMRFEVQDTKGKIQTFSRDAASQYSVRKDDTNKRQRAREMEKQKKDEEKQERAQEKARLRKLKLDEAEEKLKIMKKAAGLHKKDLDVEEWSSLLTGDWDDQDWQKKFEQKFGDRYYADQDQASLDDEEEEVEEGQKKKKPRKPKFDDDIDITDLVPDFDEEQTFSITEDEEEDTEDASRKKKKKSKDVKKEKEEAKREARKERRKLEAIVNEKLDADIALNTIGSDKTKTSVAPFRYRETSPTSYGLTSGEILMASDSQLNQFVGIKKLASFRDDVKKRKDKKHLGKKARLRKWRQETFGNENGPQKTLQDLVKESEE